MASHLLRSLHEALPLVYVHHLPFPSSLPLLSPTHEVGSVRERFFCFCDIYSWGVVTGRNAMISAVVRRSARGRQAPKIIAA